MAKTRSRFTAHKVVQQDIVGDRVTKQSFEVDADVNTIVRRHLSGVGRTLGNIGAGGTRQPIFGDFSAVDYQEMLNTVTDIDNVFRRLPARVRNRFANDPYQILRFVEDPANMQEAVKLGLMAVPEGFYMTEDRRVVPVKPEAQVPPEVPKPKGKAKPED